MKNVKLIAVDEYLTLLRVKESGVLLELATMPHPIEQYAAFCAQLERDDVDRLYLWFEFRRYTAGTGSKLTDVTDAADHVKQVRSFIDGNPNLGKGPADLRKSPGLEPMLVAESLHRGPLYAVDGNHRIIAQHRSGKDFEDVPVFVLTHPSLMKWAYVQDVVSHWSSLR